MELTLKESISKLNKIKRKISRHKKCPEDIKKLENRNCFKESHYNKLFGQKFGILNKSAFEILGFQGLAENVANIPTYYERCTSLIDKIIDAVDK